MKKFSTSFRSAFQRSTHVTQEKPPLTVVLVLTALNVGVTLFLPGSLSANPNSPNGIMANLH